MEAFTISCKMHDVDTWALINHFLYLNINLETIFTYSLLQFMRLYWGEKRNPPYVSKCWNINWFLNHSCPFKSKTAESSREIKEPTGLTLGFTMHTFFLQNSLGGRISLEEILLPPMPLMVLLIPKCTPSPASVHSYPHLPDSKAALLPDFPLSWNDITSTQCSNQSWVSTSTPPFPSVLTSNQPVLRIGMEEIQEGILRDLPIPPLATFPLPSLSPHLSLLHFSKKDVFSFPI